MGIVYMSNAHLGKRIGNLGDVVVYGLVDAVDVAFADVVAVVIDVALVVVALVVVSFVAAEFVAVAFAAVAFAVVVFVPFLVVFVVDSAVVGPVPNGVVSSYRMA